jgi:hypothetical protein
MKVPETLQSLRKKAAQEAFENAEIDGLEGFENTWNEDGVFWSRKIYREDKPGESKVGSFGIRFQQFSDLIAETWQN